MTTKVQTCLFFDARMQGCKIQCLLFGELEKSSYLCTNYKQYERYAKSVGHQELPFEETVPESVYYYGLRTNNDQGAIVPGTIVTTIREYFARVKMFMDLMTDDDKMNRE